MTSKEALITIERYVEYNLNKEFEIVFNALNRLEMLEKENKELKNKLKRFIPKVVVRNTFDNVLPSLEEENEKLKNAIEILKNKFDIELSDFSEYDNEENVNVYLLTLESKDINCDEYCERATTSLNKEEAEIIKNMLLK